MNEEQTKETFKCCQGKNHKNFSGAFVLILFGVIFLLNNFGLLPWGVWGFIWSLWPLILIISGLEMVVGSSGLIQFVIMLIILVIMAFTLIPSLNRDFKIWMQKQSWQPIIEKQTPLKKNFFNDNLK